MILSDCDLKCIVPVIMNASENDQKACYSELAKIANKYDINKQVFVSKHKKEMNGKELAHAIVYCLIKQYIDKATVM